MNVDFSVSRAGTNQTFPILKSTGVCASSGATIHPGDVYYAVLAESPDTDELHPFVRFDFSQTAWDGGDRPESPLVVFASWRTMLGEPGTQNNPLVADGDALELFLELSDAIDRDEGLGHDDAERVRSQAMPAVLRYVLGLMLARRRKLRILTTQKDSMRVKVMVKDHTEYEREIDVPTPTLTAEQIERVAVQLEPSLQSNDAQGAA